jgi:hypothetical protein
MLDVTWSPPAQQPDRRDPREKGRLMARRDLAAVPDRARSSSSSSSPTCSGRCSAITTAT